MAPHHQNVGTELVRHMADDGPGVPVRNLHLDLHLVVILIHVLILQQNHHAGCEIDLPVGRRPAAIAELKRLCP